MKLGELEKYKNKQIAILGFWKEGKSTLNFLKDFWMQNITILDSNIDIVKEKNHKYILWGGYLADLWKYDLIFKSPWISPYNKQLSKFKSKLITQTQVFFDNYKWKVIWITWTKGKSTTSTLCYETLKEIWYDVKLVWNIGNPVFDEVDIYNEQTHDFIVYELSSYMLEWLNLKLYIWVVNNIYNCHLDWHSWRKNYETAKFWVIKDAENKLINFELKNYFNNSNSQIKYFWENWDYSFHNPLFYINEQQIMKDENIKLKWEHNRKNICVIIWVLDIIDKDNMSENLLVLEKVLSNFKWLSHRMEDIWTYNWIQFIDDAIATTPESTIAAIKTYGNNIWTILLGWEDSWFEYNKLRDVLKDNKISNIVLFPDTWEKVFWNLSKFSYETEFNLEWEYSPLILKTKTLKSAVAFAYKNTQKWKICILSNAAPSFSLWSWFIAKWLEYQKEVKNYVLD